MKNLIVGSKVKFKLKSWSEHIATLDPRTTSVLLKDVVRTGVFSHFVFEERGNEIVKLIVIDDIAYDLSDVVFFS